MGKSSDDIDRGFRCDLPLQAYDYPPLNFVANVIAERMISLADICRWFFPEKWMDKQKDKPKTQQSKPAQKPAAKPAPNQGPPKAPAGNRKK